MAIASSADNIRYNGTGIAYAATVGSVNPGADLGELEGFSFNQSVTKSQLKSTRNAARGVILEAVDETTATLKFGLKEQTEENLKVALMAASVSSDNQVANGVYQTTKTWVADEYIDLGKLNVYSTKVTGTITGTLAIGDTVTGDVSNKTGKIAFVGTNFIELVEVSGPMDTDTKLTKDVGNYITVSGLAVQDDVVIVSSDGATRRVQGTDYTIEPKAGYVRKLTGGSLADADKVSFDYSAVTRKVLYGLSSNTVLRKVTFVTDADDYGPRKRYTFHKVNLSPEGDMTLLGDGTEVLNVTGTVVRDTTQQSGQEYYKVEVME